MAGTLPAGVEISTDKARLDVALIHEFLHGSYWVPGIARAAVERSIEHSLCFGVYVEGSQVGFARLVTDYVRFAHLMDVFILPAFRGRGLSKSLMQSILGHPSLGTVSRSRSAPATRTACMRSSALPRRRTRNARWSCFARTAERPLC